MNTSKQCLAFLVVLFTWCSSAHAVSTFGAMASGSDLVPAASASDGGAGSAAALVTGPTFNAEAGLGGPTFTPLLKADSVSTGAVNDDDFTSAVAQAYQAYTSTADQTITLNISLHGIVTNLGTPLSNSFVLADVFVYGGSGFSVADTFCSPGRFTFDSVYLCGSRLGRSNLFINNGDVTLLDTLTFSVLQGEQFGIYGILRAS